MLLGLVAILLTYTDLCHPILYLCPMLTCGRYVNTTYGERLKVIKAKPCRQELSEILAQGGHNAGHEQIESGAS